MKKIVLFFLFLFFYSSQSIIVIISILYNRNYFRLGACKAEISYGNFNIAINRDRYYIRIICIEEAGIQVRDKDVYQRWQLIARKDRDIAMSVYPVTPGALGGLSVIAYRAPCSPMSSQTYRKPAEHRPFDYVSLSSVFG